MSNKTAVKNQGPYSWEYTAEIRKIVSLLFEAPMFWGNAASKIVSISLK